MTAEEERQRIYDAFTRKEPEGQRATAAERAPQTWWERVRDNAGDYMEGAVSGLARGVAGSPGGPADIVRLGQMARDYTRSTNIGGPSEGTYKEVRARRDPEREEANPALLKPSNLQEYGSQRFIERANEQLEGDDLLYKPTTAIGRGLQGVGEVAGGAAVGGLSGGARALPRTVVRTGVIPGTAVEGAKAAGVENPVALGAIGLGAGAAATATGGRTAASTLGRRTGAATEQQLREAEELFQFAQERGLPLTRANALDQVTGGATTASGLQRVVEGQSSPEMARFYTNSPERIGRAGTAALDAAAGPASPQPSTVGPRVAEQMQRELRDVEAGINRQTRPAYQQLEQTPVDNAEFARLMQDPLFAREHGRVMTAPEYNYLTAGLQADSVGAIELTRRILAQRERQAQNPVTEAYDPTGATGFSRSGDTAGAAANQASRQAVAVPTGGPSPLELVRGEQSRLRGELVDPRAQGPEGRLAAAGTTEQAQGGVFRQKPQENEALEVGRAVTSLTRRDPQAAAELVRGYLGREFAQARTPPQGGGGQFSWSAPAFARQVYGNPERRAVVEAAIGALPNGQGRLGAFDEIMRVFDAMGLRQRIGSQTAFNTEDLARLRQSGFSEGSIKILAGAGVKWPQKALDAIEGWRLRGNVEELASLITDPARGAEFAAIARSQPGSPQRLAQIIRLANRGAVGALPTAGKAVREEEGRELGAAGGYR